MIRMSYDQVIIRLLSGIKHDTSRGKRTSGGEKVGQLFVYGTDVKHFRSQ